MKSLSLTDRLFAVSTRYIHLGIRLLLKSQRPGSIACKTWYLLYKIWLKRCTDIYYKELMILCWYLPWQSLNGELETMCRSAPWIGVRDVVGVLEGALLNVVEDDVDVVDVIWSEVTTRQFMHVSTLLLSWFARVISTRHIFRPRGWWSSINVCCSGFVGED